MPVIQKKVTLAAGATSDNALSGSAFEFPQRNSLVSIGVLASAAGAFANIQAGSDIVLEESELAVGTRYPVIPDEMYYADVAAQGDRLVVRLRNPTGGNVDFYVMCQVTGL